jgi:indole-3-glycerol phosphate synthase
MNVLDEIIAFKKDELKTKKTAFPVSKLKKSLFFSREMPSFYKALINPGPLIIGEFKRKSPSKGIINNSSEVEDVARGYEEAGVAAMSILTDLKYFGGENHDLQKVAGFAKIPLLRKEFIVDEYQIFESKAIGASAILLIASVLSNEEVHAFAGLASDLGLDVLFEIHEKKDIEKLNDKIRIIGVNNRNLKTFDVSMNNSRELLSKLPVSCLKVAESGFSTCKDVNELFALGYDVFLIGENFMRSDNPGETAKNFIDDLKKSIG